MSKSSTNATVVHAKNALKEKNSKNSYFYKYDGNYCKQTLSKSRDGYSGKAIYKGRKRPLSPESEATSSGSGSSTLDQWRGRKQSGNGNTHSKSVNTAAYSESNRGPEFSEEFKYEIQNKLKRIPHRKKGQIQYKKVKRKTGEK